MPWSGAGFPPWHGGAIYVPRSLETLPSDHRGKAARPSGLSDEILEAIRTAVREEVSRVGQAPGAKPQKPGRNRQRPGIAAENFR
jgi:hypothetical protein